MYGKRLKYLNIELPNSIQIKTDKMAKMVKYSTRDYYTGNLNRGMTDIQQMFQELKPIKIEYV